VHDGQHPPTHHSFLDQQRLPWNQLPVTFITLTTTPNPAAKKKVPSWAQSDPSGSIWHPKRRPNPLRMCSVGEFFVKQPTCDPLAPAQSKHCFWHVILCRLQQQCGPGGPLKSVCKILIQNVYILCALGSFWVPRVRFQRSPWATICPSFSTLFAWPGRMISQGWFRRPVLTDKRPSRHTNQQFWSQNDSPGTQTVRLTN
jgi:hypothetical protein